MEARESDLVSYTGEGVGRLTSSGTIWYGAILYKTSSTCKLSFLNEVVGLFEAELDAEIKKEHLGMEVSSGFLFSFSD
jgi:hypothetical protein